MTSDASTAQDDRHDVLAFPASPAQEAFFYLEKLFPVHPAFNVPVRFRLDGALDVPLLKKAFDAVAARHEGMRTRFVEDDGHLLQIIEPVTHFPLPVTDLTHLSGDAQEAEVDRLGSLEARQHFDLSQDPLFRASLLALAPDRHILQITIHHSVADGWSIGIITDDLAEYYNAFLQDREPRLPDLPVQYADFTLWQKEFLEGPEIRPHLDYWKEKLRGYTELELPADRPRPANKSWDGDIVSHILPASMTEKVARLSREQGATMFHIFLAAFKAVASRYTGLDDIAIGTPVAGRTRAELEPVLGTFINTVILRTDLSGDPTFRQLINRVRDTATEAIAHQDLPFEQLVKALQPRRDPGRNPLFQINFTHQRDFVRPVSFGGARLTAFPSRSPGAIFDLHFFMVERSDGWRASCDFSRDLFDRETALRLLEHFETLLEAAATDPDRPLSTLPLLPAKEARTLAAWSGRSPAYPAEKSLGDLFLERARRHPDRTALTYDGSSISYSTLADAALALSRRLIENGIRPGDRVALCAPSTPGMIAAQLGIVLTGAACVPLDPSYPPERLRFMLADSAAKLLLVDPSLTLPATTLPVISLGEHTLPACPLPHPAEGLLNPGAFQRDLTEIIPPIPNLPPDTPSHIFYTSGSTGEPKGVVVLHRGISRLVLGGDFIDFGPEDSFLQAAPISFDAATLEIWMPLLHGGRIVLTGASSPSLETIARLVKQENVTNLWLTAGLFQAIVDEHLNDLRGLRHLLAGGDILSPSHVRRAFENLPSTRIVNGYGPTENTTFTCCHTVTAADLHRPSVPIGRPIGNTTVHILDAQLRPLPIGVPGELYTGGHGLAAGYLNRPDLTAERFITPSNSQLYRTGDLARWLPDGSIEFLGRLDNQVKIRGFRIETGEIETALTAHPSVTQAKVAVRGADAGSKKLLAWIVPASGATPSTAELRDHLKARLPAYMLPAGIGTVDAFPLNANGKIDLNTLPDPTADPIPTSSAPATDSEKRLAALWSELLERPSIGRDDDWFDLGGHSLLALRLFSRIHREFGQTLPLSTLLTHSTVRALAVFLDTPADTSATRDEAALVITLNQGPRTPLFGIHGGDGAILFYRELAARLPERPFHALESRHLSQNGPIAVGSIEQTAGDYIKSIRRIQPRGPYALAGYSFGGLVAWEIACQLEAAGEKVAFLSLFDTVNPLAPSRALSSVERVAAFWSHHDEVPAARRLGLLASRFIEGARTHLRVKKEVAEAAAVEAPEANTDLRRVKLREAHYQAMLDYRPPVFRGTAHLLKVRFPGDQREIPADYGWSSQTAGGLVIREVPGKHLTIFDPENVPELARILGDALDRSVP